jgi:hypothetical protein
MADNFYVLLLNELSACMTTDIPSLLLHAMILNALHASFY